MADTHGHTTVAIINIFWWPILSASAPAPSREGIPTALLIANSCDALVMPTPTDSANSGPKVIGIASVSGCIKLTTARKENIGSLKVFKPTIFVFRFSYFRGGRESKLAMPSSPALIPARIWSVVLMPISLFSSKFVKAKDHTKPPRAATSHISRETSWHLRVLTSIHGPLCETTAMCKILREDWREDIDQKACSNTDKQTLTAYQSPDLCQISGCSNCGNLT
ncbi:hypothetical protein J1614_004800 [Plenodomus biglobosus]|nr:hypothetical protein J1614_004800 [Plenodomus biglobosus]